MTSHEMIVTDVTCYSSLFCVAGLDRKTGLMVRPEPPTAKAASEVSRFWGATVAGPGKLFAVGNIVAFDSSPPPADFPFPHATEDRLVTVNVPGKIVGTVALPDLPSAVSASVSASVVAAFDNGVIKAPSGKPYVPSNHNGRSLGSIEVLSERLSFHENNYKPANPKLRAYLNDGGVLYDLPVTSEAAIGMWRQAGIDGLTAHVRGKDRVHIRLGLSRPFSAKPDECYVQVNGIYPVS